ncbi:hypothetical protein Q4575_15335 [Psychrosphaera sp. 1_MG-2023]|uniref:hypothetical protein n=1 Tax=Psychrosphaera sp. 1_MG-2023 TaxID=3062643 RepID=UPI0026E25FC3|nr:hypothetical protein [Psychrosphaera sp. 1_MG-2023]MDO6720786.1 hypothetical protein [Psychrosphaera sp. 1_MG-2023]
MSSRFEHCIEALLNQNVICEVTDLESFTYLDNSENENSVSNFLHRVGRKVIRTRDKKGFYCVFSSIEETKKRNAVERHFDNVIVNLEGLINWLKLVRNADNESRPIEAGMRLHESELLAAIEESSSLNLQLDNIAHQFNRAQKSTEAKSKLRSILHFLVGEKYFTCIGNTGAVYVATAKWSLIYEQLEFIRMYDGFDDDDEDEVLELQSELF